MHFPSSRNPCSAPNRTIGVTTTTVETTSNLHKLLNQHCGCSPRATIMFSIANSSKLVFYPCQSCIKSIRHRCKDYIFCPGVQKSIFRSNHSQQKNPNSLPKFRFWVRSPLQRSKSHYRRDYYHSRDKPLIHSSPQLDIADATKIFSMTNSVSILAKVVSKS